MLHRPSTLTEHAHNQRILHARSYAASVYREVRGDVRDNDADSDTDTSIIDMDLIQSRTCIDSMVMGLDSQNEAGRHDDSDHVAITIESDDGASLASPWEQGSSPPTPQENTSFFRNTTCMIM